MLLRRVFRGVTTVVKYIGPARKGFGTSESFEGEVAEGTTGGFERNIGMKLDWVFDWRSQSEPSEYVQFELYEQPPPVASKKKKLDGDDCEI